MTAQIIKNMQKTAGQIACGSAFYNWSLRGNIPTHMVITPVDPWPGNADGARFLCSGSVVIDDEGSDLHHGWHSLRQISTQGWNTPDIEPVWLDFAHGFTWLRGLRALGGDVARRHARAMIEGWIERYHRWSEKPWRADLTGERLAIWIALYDNFGASAEDRFQNIFFDSTLRQAKHLSRILPEDLHGIALLKGIKGLLYAGLALEGQEAMAEQALDLLATQIQIQILKDGAHISRCPSQLLQALQILLDIRGALKIAKYPLPPNIQHAIDRMGPAVRFFRYSDKSFAMFNGTQENNESFIDCVLGQASVRGKGLQSLPCTGYERITVGRTLLMFDCGKPPAYPHDARAHAAPLSFEMSYGRERVFVSCGSHPTSDTWRESLRATAAHNTVTLNHRNACEIRSDGHFQRSVKNISVHKEQDKTAALIEATHDGYIALNGVTHRRRLYLSSGGHDLRGEETLSCSIGLSRAIDVAVRFHLHPRVIISLVQNGEEALLRLPNGVGWRFKHSGVNTILSLEDSIYLGEGARPRKTKQLVIQSQMIQDVTQVKWSLQKEG